MIPPRQRGELFVRHDGVPPGVVRAQAVPAVPLQRKEFRSNPRKPSPGNGEEPGDRNVVKLQSPANETEDILA